MTLTTAPVLPTCPRPRRTGRWSSAVVLTSGAALRSARPPRRARRIVERAPTGVVVLDTTASGSESAVADVVTAAHVALLRRRRTSASTRVCRIARRSRSGSRPPTSARTTSSGCCPSAASPSPAPCRDCWPPTAAARPSGLVGPKHVDACRPRHACARSASPSPAPVGSSRTRRWASRTRASTTCAATSSPSPWPACSPPSALLRELGGWERPSATSAATSTSAGAPSSPDDRVVVAPDARMRSVASLGLATATNGARRRAARRVALARAPWWTGARPRPVGPAQLASPPAVGLLLLKRPRAAAAGVRGPRRPRPGRVASLGRLRTRGGRELRHRDIATLFVPASDVVRAAPRPRPRGARRTVTAPRRGRDATTRPSSVSARRPAHPAVLAVLATLAVVVGRGSRHRRRAGQPLRVRRHRR